MHFQVALKQSPLEPDDMFYRKQKLAELSQKSFTLMLHVLFYVFLLRTFFKTIVEPLHLLRVHPKLIFWCVLKKALMIPPEDRLYQTQYFAEIFPSPLALTLQIHFYFHLQESA